MDKKLDFNTGVPILSFEVNNLIYDTESIVVVCDINNEVLFYSDGSNIYNNTHQIMANGVGLFNSHSTSQGILVTKSMEEFSKYYLYHLADAYDNDGKLFVSEIDIKLNENLGDIIPNSTQVVSQGFTEKMVSCIHPCGGIWLITHERNNDIFLSYHIYEGKILQKVLSKTGSQNILIGDKLGWIGSMHISKENILVNLSRTGLFELFKFDPYTGLLSDPLTLYKGDLTNPNRSSYYTGAFSPNNRFFYLIDGDNTGSWVEQYDLSQYDANFIKSNMVKIGNISNQYGVPVSNLKLAPDNKIYYVSRVKNNTLGVIESPDIKGTGCNFLPEGIDLGDTPFFASALPTPLVIPKAIIKDFLPGDTSFCTNPFLTITPSYTGYDSLQWSDGQTSPTLEISAPGMYALTIYKNGCEYQDSIIIEQKVSRMLEIGPDISLCQAERHFISIPVHPGDQILWSDGSTEAERTLTESGNYFVDITTLDGCIISDTIAISRSYVKISKVISIDLCDGDNYTYNGKDYLPGQNITDSIAAVSGCDTLITIKLRPVPEHILLQDSFTCDNKTLIIQNKPYNVGDTILRYIPATVGCDTLIKTVYQTYSLPEFSVFVKDTVLCDGETTKVTASVPGNINWSTGNNESSVTLSPGNYTVSFTDDIGCVQTKSVSIQSVPDINYDINIKMPDCDRNNGSIRVVSEDSPAFFEISINDMPALQGMSENLGAGNYIISIIDKYGCINNDTVILTSINEYSVSMSDEVSIEKMKLHAMAYTDSGGTTDTILFSPDINIQAKRDSILISGVEDRIYSISFVDQNGCIFVKSLKVNVTMPETNYVLPNIISTSSAIEGNKHFYLKSTGITYDMSIYDRWGNQIYDKQNIEGGNPESAWTPEKSKVQPGVYVFFLTINASDKKIQKVGTVTVL